MNVCIQQVKLASCSHAPFASMYGNGYYSSAEAPACSFQGGGAVLGREFLQCSQFSEPVAATYVSAQPSSSTRCGAQQSSYPGGGFGSDDEFLSTLPAMNGDWTVTFQAARQIFPRSDVVTAEQPVNQSSSPPNGPGAPGCSTDSVGHARAGQASDATSRAPGGLPFSQISLPQLPVVALQQVPSQLPDLCSTAPAWQSLSQASSVALPWPWSQAPPAFQNEQGQRTFPASCSGPPSSLASILLRSEADALVHNDALSDQLQSEQLLAEIEAHPWPVFRRPSVPSAFCGTTMISAAACSAASSASAGAVTIPPRFPSSGPPTPNLSFHSNTLSVGRQLPSVTALQPNQQLQQAQHTAGAFPSGAQLQPQPFSTSRLRQMETALPQPAPTAPDDFSAPGGLAVPASPFVNPFTHATSAEAHAMSSLLSLNGSDLYATEHLPMRVAGGSGSPALLHVAVPTATVPMKQSFSSEAAPTGVVEVAAMAIQSRSAMHGRAIGASSASVTTVAAVAGLAGDDDKEDEGDGTDIYTDGDGDGGAARPPHATSGGRGRGGGGERRRGGSGGRAGRGAGSRITLETLRAMFEMPVLDVVQSLGISATDLKRRCRALGIQRWPQRKLLSLKRLAEAVEGDGELTEEERRDMLERVARNRAAIFENPDVGLEGCLKPLRQVHYKRNFIDRCSGGGGGKTDKGKDCY